MADAKADSQEPNALDAEAAGYKATKLPKWNDTRTPEAVKAPVSTLGHPRSS